MKRPALYPLAIIILTCFASCAFYKPYPLPKERIMKVKDDRLNYYLVDEAHPKTRGWYISDCIITDSLITGYLSQLSELETFDISTTTGRLDAKLSKNDVVFFAKPEFADNLPEKGTLHVNLDQLNKIQVYELNQAKTVLFPLTPVLAFLTIVRISNY